MIFPCHFHIITKTLTTSVNELLNISSKISKSSTEGSLWLVQCINKDWISIFDMHIVSAANSSGEFEMYKGYMDFEFDIYSFFGNFHCLVYMLLTSFSPIKQHIP